MHHVEMADWHLDSDYNKTKTDRLVSWRRRRPNKQVPSLILTDSAESFSPMLKPRATTLQVTVSNFRRQSCLLKAHFRFKSHHKWHVLVEVLVIVFFTMVFCLPRTVLHPVDVEADDFLGSEAKQCKTLGYFSDQLHDSLKWVRWFDGSNLFGEDPMRVTWFFKDGMQCNSMLNSRYQTRVSPADRLLWLLGEFQIHERAQIAPCGANLDCEFAFWFESWSRFILGGNTVEDPSSLTPTDGEFPFINASKIFTESTDDIYWGMRIVFSGFDTNATDKWKVTLMHSTKFVVRNLQAIAVREYPYTALFSGIGSVMVGQPLEMSELTAMDAMKVILMYSSWVANQDVPGVSPLLNDWEKGLFLRRRGLTKRFPDRFSDYMASDLLQLNLASICMICHEATRDRYPGLYYDELCSTWNQFLLTSHQARVGSIWKALLTGDLPLCHQNPNWSSLELQLQSFGAMVVLFDTANVLAIRRLIMLSFPDVDSLIRPLDDMKRTCTKQAADFIEIVVRGTSYDDEWADVDVTDDLLKCTAEMINRRVVPLFNMLTDQDLIESILALATSKEIFKKGPWTVFTDTGDVDLPSEFKPQEVFAHTAPNFLTALYAYLSGTTMDHLDEFWAYMIDEAAGAFESGRSMEDLRYYSLTSEEVARFPMWFTWGPRVPLETAFPMKRGRVDVTADLAHTSDWHFGLWVYLWLTSSLLITEHVVELQNVGHRVIHIRAIEFIYSFFLFFSLWQAFLSLITMLTMQIPFPAANVSMVFVVTFLAGMQNFMFVLFLCCVLENRYFVSLATLVATTTQLVIMCAVNIESPSKTRVYATLLLSPTATIAPALRYLIGINSTPLHQLRPGYVYTLQSAFICLLFTLTLIAWPDRGHLRLRRTSEGQDSHGWFNLEFVSVTYASNSVNQNSVYQFNLAVEAGAVAYVVGDSKCGVRAVHELATGILRPSAGDVVCLGKAVLGTNYECGFFDSHIRLMNHMTVEQHLRMVAVFKGLPRSSEASGIRTLLVLFGIQKLANQNIRNLSWASRKIVALACSLVGWPKVVAWHQPFEGLDPFFVSRCMRVIDHLRNEDVAILITTKALRRLPVHVSSRSNTKLVFLRDGYTQFQTNDVRSLNLNVGYVVQCTFRQEACLTDFVNQCASIEDSTLLSVINLTVDVGVESDTSLPKVFRLGNEALAVSVTNNVIPYISDLYDSQLLCSNQMSRDLSSGFKSLSTFAFIDGAAQFDRSHLPKMKSGSFANGMSQFKHHLFSHFKYLQQHRVVFVFQLFSFVLVMLVYEWTLVPVTTTGGHAVTLLGPYPWDKLPADAAIVPAAKDFKCSAKILDRLGLKLHRVDDVSSYLAKSKKLHVIALDINTFWHNSQVYTWAFPAAWAVHYVCSHNMMGWPTLEYIYFNRPQSNFLGLLLTNFDYFSFSVLLVGLSPVLVIVTWQFQRKHTGPLERRAGSLNFVDWVSIVVGDLLPTLLIQCMLYVASPLMVSNVPAGLYLSTVVLFNVASFPIIYVLCRFMVDSTHVLVAFSLLAIFSEFIALLYISLTYVTRFWFTLATFMCPHIPLVVDLLTGTKYDLTYIHRPGTVVLYLMAGGWWLILLVVEHKNAIRSGVTQWLQRHREHSDTKQKNAVVDSEYRQINSYFKSSRHLQHLGMTLTDPISRPGLMFTGVEYSVVSHVCTKATRKTIINPIWLQCNADEVTTIFGLNMSGKRTLMRILADELQPRDLAVVPVPPTQRIRWLDASQDRYLHLTPRQLINLMASMTGISKWWTKIFTREVLHDLLLVDLADVPLRDVPYSLRRHLMVMLTFMGNPSIVVIDEPALMCDDRSRQDIWRLLAACKRDRTIIIMSSQLHDVEYVSDKVSLLDKGNQVWVGHHEELRMSDNFSLRICFASEPRMMRLLAALKRQVNAKIHQTSTLRVLLIIKKERVSYKRLLSYLLRLERTAELVFFNLSDMGLYGPSFGKFKNPTADSEDSL